MKGPPESSGEEQDEFLCVQLEVVGHTEGKKLEDSLKMVSNLFGVDEDVIQPPQGNAM